MPPLGVFRHERFKIPLHFSCIQRIHRQFRHILLAVKGCGARDQDRELSRARRGRKLHGRFIQKSRVRFACHHGNRHRGGIEELLFRKPLRQQNRSVLNVQLRSGQVIGRPEDDCVIARELPIHVGEVLLGVPQHAQVNVDGFRLRALVVNFDRDHIVCVPRHDACRQAGSFGRHHAIVNSQVLVEATSGEDVRAGAGHIDIHVTAAAGVIVVLMGKADRRGVHAEHIAAVNLKLQCRGGRPHQTSHPPIANGHSFLTACRWVRVIKIASRDAGFEIGT